MPHWYWDRTTIQTKTPSIQDGIDYATEYRYRKEGARFIIDVGAEMDLGYNTLATGVVFFHRFYMFHSFKDFPRYVTACCCLFLAGKVEETPKKCKDIIKVAQNILSEEYFASFGDDPKEEVMILEKILLQTIKFDLKVQHPYSYLTKYAKCLKGDKAKLQKMVQMAWTFINDSLCTTLSIEWEPEIIAIAVMYLAGKLIQFKVIDWSFRHPKHLRWWDVFVEDLQMDVLEDICHQILDLYPPINVKSQQALPTKDSQNPANNVKPQATNSTTNIFKCSNIHISTTVTVSVTTNTTVTTTTTNTIINSIASPSVYKSYLKNSETMNTSSFDDSSRNLPNPATPKLPWTSTVPFTPRNTQCSLTAPKTDSTVVPSPSVNVPNLYGTSENTGYFKNDSPTLNCSIDHKIFDQLMENQYQSSMDHQNMSFFDKMDRPYYKYSTLKTANSPEWFRRRRGYNREGDDYSTNTTNRNFRRHRRTNYSQQFYD